MLPAVPLRPENDITDVLDLTFTEEEDFFGRKRTVELRPGGAHTKASVRAHGHDAVMQVLSNTLLAMLVPPWPRGTLSSMQQSGLIP